jgi:hypothetical protein
MLASSAATSHIAGQSELQSVVQAIARLPRSYTDLDLRQCAATLSLNHPQVRTARIYVNRALQDIAIHEISPHAQARMDQARAELAAVGQS